MLAYPFYMSAKKLAKKAHDSLKNATTNLEAGKVWEALTDVRIANVALQTLERLNAGVPPPKLGE